MNTADANAAAQAPTPRCTLVGAVSLAVIAFVMLTTVRDYGLTWDEEFQSVYGELVLSWFRSGFREDTALVYKNLYLYGGFFDVLAQLFARLSPWDLYEDRHLVNVAFALLALAGTWRLGTLMLGDRGGVFAMALTALTPMFYGHSFNNPKDIPFAALFVWTLCQVFETARSLPVISKWATAKLTICLGLVLAIRPGGIFVFGYVVLWWALSLVRAGRVTRPAVLHAGGRLAIVLLGAWIIMLSAWPWAQVDPIMNPLRGMKNAVRFSFTGTTLFFGQQVPARPAPLSYLPTWFALQLPETYLVAAGAGIVGYLARRRRKAEKDLGETGQRWGIARLTWLLHSPTSTAALWFLTFVVLFPIATAVILRSTLYDAVRHFLFLIPPLAVLAAAGIHSGLRPPVPRLGRATIAFALLATAALTVHDMVVLHPYESVYFNRLVAGGLPGAAGRFETDYWGNSYREAVEWVMTNVPGDAIRIANCSHPLQTAYYLRGPSGARFVSVPFDATSDLLLATTRWDCHRKAGARVLHTVERQGVALAYVLDLRPPQSGSSHE